jgi:hypothetical protein
VESRATQTNKRATRFPNNQQTFLSIKPKYKDFSTAVEMTIRVIPISFITFAKNPVSRCL